MTGSLFLRLRLLNEYILEAGFTRSVLALPAPRMLALGGPATDQSSPTLVFSVTITEPEIESVSRDLFASGHYSIAVQEAFKALEKFVLAKSGHGNSSATSMMEAVFSPSSPKLFWSDRATQSEQDEQKGYQRIFSGVMLGIRNPVTHEQKWIDDADTALELLALAQHLLRKAKAATVVVLHDAGRVDA